MTFYSNQTLTVFDFSTIDKNGIELIFEGGLAVNGKYVFQKNEPFVYSLALVEESVNAFTN